MKRRLIVVTTFALGFLALTAGFAVHRPRSLDARPISMHTAALFYPEQIDGLVSNGVSVNELDDDGVTPLWHAVMHQKHTGVMKLLSHDADPNVQIERRDSPLTVAAMWGNIATVKALLEHGADVNGQYMSRTALHHAIIYGHGEIVDILLADTSIDINRKEMGTGQTPLHVAVQHDRGFAIERLLSMGADASVADNAGNTPLDLAKHESDRSITECFVQLEK